jgi:hypothetical protein
VSIIAAGRPSLLKTCTPGGREMEKLTINPMQPCRLSESSRWRSPQAQRLSGAVMRTGDLI